MIEETYGFDAIGNEELQIVEVAKLWADIKTVKGIEYFAAGATRNEVVYRFIIRYNKKVNEKQKIIFEGKTYNIEAVLNDDERKYTMTVIASIKY